MKRLMILLLNVIMIQLVNTIEAQTWNGSVNTDWNNASNWTPAAIPGTSASVTINNILAPNQPVLSGDVNITSLNMSGGILNLNGYSITCSGHAIFTGDSLKNGKVTANTFDNIANMHMGGKVIFEKTGPSNEFWGGNNKMYGDSLIVIWRWGSLHLQNVNPDSIFANLKIQLADAYSVLFAENAMLYVQKNLILDNSGNGTFSCNSNYSTFIEGNLTGINFTSATPNLVLKNFITRGNNANGPFYCHTGSITNCNFNGNFTLVADSAINLSITNSSFLGANNLLQAGSLWTQNNHFGQTGPGTTILRSAYSGTDGYIRMRGGNNKFFGNAQWETYASYPGGITIEHTYYGPDTTLGNLSFILKGNASLVTNSNGNSYVGGDVTIDAQGARKWVQFTGGGSTFTVDGNFTAKNFTPLPQAGVPANLTTNVHLRNVHASGIDTCGTFYCFTGDITNCSFNGNFKLIADSAASYDINNAAFLGADNLFQALAFNAHDSRFGKPGSGATILRSANKTGDHVFTRFGNNKFYGNAQLETYAAYPGGITIQQTFFGKDTCFGNFNYLLKGNASLVTNESGNSYVAGNVTIDAQGARKWVQFTGGTSTFSVGGNFTVKNFTPLPETGVPANLTTNVHLRNLYVNGTDTCGTFYCFTGDITNSSFNGNFKLIADSAAAYDINNAAFLGADNLFQALAFNAHDSRFGKPGSGATILRSANKTGDHVFTRFGNNKFYGNAQLETYAAYPGGVTIQQTFFGKDTCFGNFNYLLKGNASLVTNESGNSYVAGNVTIDAQGARKWVQFTGGASTFSVGGNFTVKNFTPLPETGVPANLTTNVHLRNLYVNGTDTCGTFYCFTGDVTNSVFNGNFKLIGDSSQAYTLNNSTFLGMNNYFQSGTLEIQKSSFGQLGSGNNIFRAAHNTTGIVYVREGENKFLGNVQLEAFALSPGGTTIQQTYYGKDTCFGNLVINLSGSSNIYLAGGANLYLGKGLTLNNNSTTSGVIHNNGATAIHFIGTDTATYSYSGSGIAPDILNIVMNRRGGLRLQSPLTYSGNLLFTRGVILSSSLNPLVIPNNAIASTAWDSSYVDGPVNKTGNTAFTFPLGKNNVYAPVSITAPSLISDVFRAQYFNTNPGKIYDSTQHDLSLHHISRSEYWVLDRINGSATPKLTLSWKENRSGVVDAIADLRVVRWNGASWKDEGMGVTTGSTAEGTIQSLNSINDFSPFTLASTSVNNPLPVKFVFFNVTLRSKHEVLLKWKTAQEVNNAYYEVQRSTDGSNWMNLAKVLPQQMREYEYVDNTITTGLFYYRVKQVDQDGSALYTRIQPIRVKENNQLFIWPNPVTKIINIQTPFTKGHIQITDVSGRSIQTQIINNNITTIPVDNLTKGVYLVRIVHEGNLLTEKFIKE